MRRISICLTALVAVVLRGPIASASDARDRAAVAQAQLDCAENNFRGANIALGYARGALGAAQADQSAAECRLHEALDRYASVERASCDLSNAINVAVDDANRAAARELSAQAALTSADNRLADAQRRLDDVHAGALKAFEATEEFQAADASFRAARDAMEVAAAPVMKVLQHDSKYIELLVRFNEADRRLRDLINASAAPQQIDAAQKARDEADRALRAFVDERILADPVANVARRALDDSARRCEDLLGKFEVQFTKDPANKGVIEPVSIARASRDAADAERARAVNDRVAAEDRLGDLQSQQGRIASDLSAAQRDVDCARADLARAEQCVFAGQSNFAAAANALACARSERDGAIAQLRFVIEHDGDHRDHDRDHHDIGGSSAIVCDDGSPSLGAWTRVRFGARNDHVQVTDDRDREREKREAEFRERREKAEQHAARDRADEVARAAATPTKAPAPVVDQAAREQTERRTSEERAQRLRSERAQRQQADAKRTAEAEEQQKRRATAEEQAKRDAAQEQADENASRNREDQRKQAEKTAVHDRNAKDRAAREQQAKQQRETKERETKDREAQQQREAKDREARDRQAKERAAQQQQQQQEAKRHKDESDRGAREVAEREAARQRAEADRAAQQREAKAREDQQRQAAERERQRNDSKRDDKRDGGGGSGGNGKKGR